MNIQDRFREYRNNIGLSYPRYQYNLTLFECIIYGIVDVIFSVLEVFIFIVVILTSFIWAGPYLTYKYFNLKSEQRRKE